MIYVLVLWMWSVGVNRGKWISKGKGWETTVAIPRFQGGSPCLCWLRTASFWPRWQALICTGHLSSFMGPGKPTIPVTTLSNRTSLLRSGLLEGEWGNSGWRPGRMIAGSQYFILGAWVQFWLTRNFADGCRTWDLEGHAYDVFIRFFLCRVRSKSLWHSQIWVTACPLLLSRSMLYFIDVMD
jgi:hypothetical protein